VVFSRLTPLIGVISAVVACIPECGQRERLEKIRVSQLTDAVLLFRKENQQWPMEVSGLVPRYLKGEPTDRWGHSLHLQRRGMSLAVVSAWADGFFGTGDDVTLATVR
jgi:hypothetical protein